MHILASFRDMRACGVTAAALSAPTLKVTTGFSARRNSALKTGTRFSWNCFKTTAKTV
jgi:hypothetical protein